MIIQTGMRTDIPAFYSEWLANRIKEGNWKDLEWIATAAWPFPLMRKPPGRCYSSGEAGKMAGYADEFVWLYSLIYLFNLIRKYFIQKYHIYIK